MNIIGCHDKPTTGEYKLDGVDALKMNRDQLAEFRNQKIGFIFQSFNILARTSAQENVELPLIYNNKVGAKERKERAFNALKSVGLAERVHNMPNQLSGGQQQRVAIARALVNDPRVIMADEPTGNLDTRNSYEIMEIFQQLNEKGITIVMVTHEPDIAQFALDNIVFRDGMIVNNIKVSDRKHATEELKNLPVLAGDE
jgi:putative ABC transport system ATP-binding protein